MRMKKTSPSLEAFPFELSIAQLLRNLSLSFCPSFKTVVSAFKHDNRIINSHVSCIHRAFQTDLSFSRGLNKHFHATTRKLKDNRQSKRKKKKST